MGAIKNIKNQGLIANYHKNSFWFNRILACGFMISIIILIISSSVSTERSDNNLLPIDKNKTTDITVNNTPPYIEWKNETLIHTDNETIVIKCAVACDNNSVSDIADVEGYICDYFGNLIDHEYLMAASNDSVCLQLVSEQDLHFFNKSEMGICELYEGNYTLPYNVTEGNYTVIIEVNDTRGAYEKLTRATTCGVGACAGNTGEETFTACVWSNDTCDPFAGAAPEICDNVDNDCDGLIDEGCGGHFRGGEEIICGDGLCEGDETYETCPEDCEKPIVCGDGLCEGDETYETCPEDCEKPIVCGDGLCEGNETCKNCEGDCGPCVIETPVEEAGEIEEAPIEGAGKEKIEEPIVTVEKTPWWYYLLLLILLLFLLLLLIKKKKTVADLEFLEKAILQGKLNKVLKKFKKIYVTPATYIEIMKKTEDDRIKKMELNDKGRDYLKEVGDETVALAMQLKAKVVLTEELTRMKTAEKQEFKTLSLEKAVK